MPVTIQLARSDAEREAIYRLRYEIYVEELGFKLPADHERRLMPDSPEVPCQLLYAADGDRALGTLRMQLGCEGGLTAADQEVYCLDRFAGIVPTEQMAILTRYMTVADYRESDVPARLFDEMVRYLLERGIRMLFCDCRPHLINTYQRQGFRVYGRTYNDEEAGLLVPLVMILDDVEHFRRVRSRLLPLVEEAGPDPERAARAASLIPASGPVETLTDVTAWQDWLDVLPVLCDDSDEEIQIFEGISPEEVAAILQHSHVIRCGRGDKIIAADQDEHTMFILLEGAAEVVRDGEVVALLTPGSVVGEISFLLKRHRTADVYAAADGTEFLSLRGRNLTALIEGESRAAARLLYNLSRIMAQRLAGS